MTVPYEDDTKYLRVVVSGINHALNENGALIDRAPKTWSCKGDIKP
jgi:hypothetical protein